MEAPSRPPESGSKPFSTTAWRPPRLLPFAALAQLDCAALAFGLGYEEINSTAGLEGGIREALCREGPVLVRVVTDYGKRKVRWIDATKGRFTKELSTEQKARFLGRISARSLQPHPRND